MAVPRIGRRPKSRPAEPRPSAEALTALAATARYVGSPKHVYGYSRFKDRGAAGPKPRTVAQARDIAPEPPFTMLCPEKWNNRDPAVQATGLLRAALAAGHVSPGFPPKFAYARDPEDPSVVYRAHCMDPALGTYKAYPLTDAEIDDLDISLP